jgi:ABC transporter DrrB family efflux protein
MIDAVTDGAAAAERQLRRVWHNPSLIALTVGAPVVLIIIFGYILGSAISVPGGGDYRAFLVAGLFATMGANVVPGMTAMARDSGRGVVDRFRSLPIARAAVPFGQAAANAIYGLVSLVLMGACGLAVGWRIERGAGYALAAVALLVAAQFAATWIGMYLGLLLGSEETAGLMSIVVFPVTMVSNVFVPTQGMPAWLRMIADWNPYSAFAGAARELFGNPAAPADGAWPMLHPVLASVGWVVLLLAIFVPLCVTRYARSLPLRFAGSPRADTVDEVISPRLLAISDLHVGHPKNRAIVEAMPPGNAGDWLLVAGDVGENFADIEWALGLLAERFARVVWVPGNHELWTRRADPVTARGQERYQMLVAACRRLGVVTPEDPFPVWEGLGGHEASVTIVPLFLGYDYSFRPEGAATKKEGLEYAYQTGIVCSDERLLHPDPYPSREAWCEARLAYTQKRLAALAPGTRVVFVNHYPLVREPTRILRYPQFAQWCGTTRTADWHVRFDTVAVVYGHLHIPRVTYHNGVRFEEVSLGYPREWQRRAERFGTSRPPGGPWQILPAPAPVPAPPGFPEGFRM